ncbi:hypothetical protein NERG_01206 [Nematocida ausubeli]|uniref:Uncharacterized protein n=1 Tax=Nematocida ausubeli (strain ATCC PRA-371 / ERTm2) TaxID=1913371 RepID=H8ZBW3_NEMA1|nr:hypothetical protein NERG_01206 [Nematocida ausubeli]
MEQAKERDGFSGQADLPDITKEYIARILDPKQRQREIETNKAEVEDKTKLLEVCLQKEGIEILKDLDRLPQVIQGMKIFNKQIDNAEEQIMETSIRQNETQKALQEIKRVRERVKESIAGTRKIKELIETSKALERASNKALVKVDALVSNRKGISEEDARIIFLWLLAHKKLIIASRQFPDYSFYEDLRSQIISSEKKLVMMSNLLVQWWACEITGGIMEIAEKKEISKEDTTDETEYANAQKARQFALSNREFVRVSKYVYAELGKLDEFTDYVNNARRRELLKLCKIPIDRYTTKKRLAIFLTIFTEYLKIDTEIKSYLSQQIDPAIEEYDVEMGKKIESIIASIPEDDLDHAYIFKKIKLFFVAMQSQHEAHFKSLSEMLIQSVYKCINQDSDQTSTRICSIIAEDKTPEEILFAVASEIRRFFRDAKQMVHDIEQVENELDDIILKFTNGLVKCTGPVIQSAAEQSALIISGFAKDILESIREELIKHKCSLTDEVLQTKLPEIRRIIEHEAEILKKTEAQLEMHMSSIKEEISKNIKTMTPETKVSLYSDKVASVLEQYKGKVCIETLQKHLDSILGCTIEYIGCIKIYRQMDALENDFALLYKSVQYLNLETASTKRILKMFTEIDCLRKEEKKRTDDPITTELTTILDKYASKK